MSDGEKDSLRTRVREHIWKTIGTEPEVVDGAICPVGEATIVPWDVFGCENSDDPGCEEAEIDMLALRSLNIWSVAYTQSMAGSVAAETAYDLGDGFWYSIRVPDDSTDQSPFLCAVVPHALAEDVFARERLDWIGADEGLCYGAYPGELDGLDLTNPATFRELCGTVLGSGRPSWRPGDNFESLHEILLYFAGKTDAETFSPEEEAAIRALWHTAAHQVRSGEKQEPPGLAALSLASNAFDAWVATESLTWRDTNEALDARAANALRLVCQYLLLAARD